MDHIEKILPIIILVALTVIGKIFESLKTKATQKPPVQNPSEPSIPQWKNRPEEDMEEEEEYEPAQTPRWQPMAEPVPQARPIPQVPQYSPAAPPVAEIPDPVRALMRSLGVEVPRPQPVAPPPPVVQPTRVAEARQHVAKSIEEVAPRVAHFDVSPNAVRQGIYWKAILDEPRAKRPWRPVA